MWGQQPRLHFCLDAGVWGGPYGGSSSMYVHIVFTNDTNCDENTSETEVPAGHVKTRGFPPHPLAPEQHGTMVRRNICTLYRCGLNVQGFYFCCFCVWQVGATPTFISADLQTAVVFVSPHIGPCWVRGSRSSPSWSVRQLAAVMLKNHWREWGPRKGKSHTGAWKAQKGAESLASFQASNKGQQYISLNWKLTLRCTS